MSILSQKQLRNQLSVVLPNSRKVNEERREKQRINTKTIYDLDRKNLLHDSFERRMLIYTTLLNEKIFIEYPGKETTRNNPMPKDTCPGLAVNNEMITLDTSFGDIWDVIDSLGKEHRAYLPILATVLIHMACMQKYEKKTLDRECWNISVDKNANVYKLEQIRRATFLEINFPKRVWETLNDMFSGICIKGQKMSFEAFIKYFDVLLMNEDSKYAYMEVNTGNTTYEDWSYAKGRVNTIGTCLNVVSYLEGNMALSELLNKYQKGRGTIQFSIPHYPKVSDGMISQEN